MIYDAIIVGAGPAGASAALRLVRKGARVLLLDGQAFPRDKACGGGLMPQVSALLDWDFSQVVEARATETRFRFDFSGQPIDTPSEPILMVKRRRFDQHLVDRALVEGGPQITFIDDARIATVEETETGVTVIARSGATWKAAFLVGADGAAGVCAAAVKRPRRTRPGIALDADIEIPAEVFTAEATRVTFEFGRPRHGYGWVFPKDGYLSCGVGSWSASERLPTALDTYLQSALPLGSVLSQVRRGHPIPIYDGPTPIGTSRACLVGDAASLVDPIMGEGIRFAIWSGHIAAELILEQLAGETPLDDGSEYARRIHDAFGRDFDRQLRFIQPIFMRKPELFFSRFFAGGGNYAALARQLGERMDGTAAYPFGRRLPAANLSVQSC